MKKLAFVCLAAAILIIILLRTINRRPDERPSTDGEISAGIKRGNALRNQDRIIPEVLRTWARIFKVGQIPCGVSKVVVDEFVMNGTSYYRIVISSRDFNASFLDGALVSYDVKSSSTVLVQTDLTFVSEKSVWENTRVKGTETRLEVWSASINVENDELSWVCTRTRDGKVYPEIADKIRVYGTRPVHRHAVNFLASFAVHHNQNDSLCIPYAKIDTASLLLGTSEPSIVPVWVSFSKPNSNNGDFEMKIRRLRGTFVDGPLKTAVPDDDVWNRVDLWVVDRLGRAMKAPEDSSWRGADTVNVEDLDFKVQYNAAEIAKEISKHQDNKATK
jgi:hypothetical protein